MQFSFSNDALQTSDRANKRVLKAGVDLAGERDKRMQQSLSLRKKDRGEMVLKKRKEASGQAVDSSSSAPTCPSSQDQENVNPSCGPNYTAVQANLAQLDQYVAACWTDDREMMLQGTLHIRKLLSVEQNPPLDKVISTGVVPRLVELLSRDDHPSLQFESAWALTNIASGTSEHTLVVIQANAVPCFIRLMQSPSLEVVEQCVWALGNIAGDSPKCRDYILGLNAVQPLVAVIMSAQAKVTTRRNAVWALSNLCRGKPLPETAHVLPIVPVLASILEHQPDEEMLQDACWALSYLSDGPNDRIEMVLNSGVLGKLVQLLGSSDAKTLVPALRTVGNIVTGNDKQTQAVLNAGALSFAPTLLKHAKKNVRKEVVWMISNITAGTEEQIQTVIAAEVLPLVLQQLKSAEFEVKREAAWAVSNISSGGTADHIGYLVHIGCIPPVCDLLELPDVKIVSVALETLDNILACGNQLVDRGFFGENPFVPIAYDCGGVQKVEELQHHTKTEIYEHAVALLEKYFEVEDAVDNVEAVAAGASQMQFNF